MRKLKIDDRQRIIRQYKRGDKGWFSVMTDEELDLAFSMKPLCNIQFDFTKMIQMTKDELRRLKTIIAINHDVFALDNKAPGRTHKLELDICVPPDAEPDNQKLWRKQPQEATLINDHVQKMMDVGHIERSDSRWQRMLSW